MPDIWPASWDRWGTTSLRHELRGPALLWARALVGLYGLVLIIVYVDWLPGWVADQRAEASRAAAQWGGGLPYRELALGAIIATTLAALAWMALAMLVFLRRSRDLFGLLLTAGFVSFGVVVGAFTDFGHLMTTVRAGPWGGPLAATLFLANGLSLPWAFCFPDGRFVPRWSVGLALAWLLIWFAQDVAGSALYASPLGAALLSLVVVSIVASTGASILYRYVRRSTAVQRQQIKWVMLGALVFVAVYVIMVPTGSLLPSRFASGDAFIFQKIHLAIFALAVIAIPVALAIAIFRQGLLDIDLIINRTLTYAAITVLLAAGFLVISAASNQVLTTMTGQRSELARLLSVIPVALAFFPVRSRALQVADRFVVDRKVMTLLFVDLVASTERAYAIGDDAWRELLRRYRAAVRHCLKRFSGREIDTAGDGFFVTFDAPVRAVRCAGAIVDAVRELGLEVRAGLHIGEVQVDGSHVTGAAVHLASRVMAEAGPGEVLASAALREVVAGSGVQLSDRGTHHLKGVPADVALYAAFA